MTNIISVFIIMIIKKISSLAASIISLLIFIFFFNTNSNSDENNSKRYSNDNGVLSIMYHRFNENKYPHEYTYECFQKTYRIIADSKYEFYDPKLLRKNLIQKKMKKKFYLNR